MAQEGWIEATGEGDAVVLRAGGEWRITAAAMLDAKLEALRLPPGRRVRLDLANIEALDTAGAWLVLRLKRALAARGSDVTIENLAPDLAPLLNQVEKRPAIEPPPRQRTNLVLDGLAAVGAHTIGFLNTAAGQLGFFGLVVSRMARGVLHPGRIRLIPLLAQMERTGVSALPIVGLLSFLVGLVTAFQGAQQLQRFGAEIFVVDLLGIGFLREMGVLLTSIIMAGRTGSAFTAEIGAMQVNEEIDAMHTLGLDPIEILVLPRIFALVLTLPLLTFYADAMGILGGLCLSWLTLDIPPPVFLNELHNAITIQTLWLGIVKAPFFAGTIALVGCREGLNVTRNAESVGRHTTSSVVQSIFLVIVIDAIFSVIFSWLDL
jgi:phospholipid/cholesterol/gamma-HCH transport system permease protein